MDPAPLKHCAPPLPQLFSYALRAIIIGCIASTYARVFKAAAGKEGRSLLARSWTRAFHLKRFQNVERANMVPETPPWGRKRRWLPHLPTQTRACAALV